MKIKFSFSFLIFAALLALFVSPTMLFVYFASVILHEYAHSVAASVFNSKLDTVKLYPGGAVIFGNIDKLTPVEEIIVAFAGPVFNAVIALFCIAVWWIAPETYNYTETLVIANISLCLFNLLPVYPLDGGYVFCTLLSKKTGEKKALAITKVLGIFVSLCIFSAFILTIFLQDVSVNFTFLSISVLLFWSAIEKKSRIYFKRLQKMLLTSEDFEKGKEIFSVAVLEHFSLEKIYKLLKPEKFYKIYVYDKNLHLKKTLDQIYFCKLLEKFPLTQKIGAITIDKE